MSHKFMGFVRIAIRTWGIQALHVLVILSMVIPNLTWLVTPALAAGAPGTPAPSDSSKATPTAPLSETASPIETAVPSATATASGGNDARQTPTVTPSATIAPSETPLPTETAIPTLTATPVVTVTATPVPTNTPDPLPVIVLSVQPELVTLGFPVILAWQIQNLSAFSSDAYLVLTLPEGFTPLPGNEETPLWTADGQMVRIPVLDSKGKLTLSVSEDGRGPFSIKAELTIAEKVVAETALIVMEDSLTLIGPEGGVATGVGGHIQVSFPPNVVEGLTDEAPLSVRVRLPTSKANVPYYLGGLPFEIVAERPSSTASNGLESVNIFSQPITITVSYTDTNILGEEKALFLYYYDEEAETWMPMNSQVDVEKNILTAWSDHLTIFDINAQDWEAARLPTMDGFQVSSFTGAATYSFPIQVSAGPGGLQPSVGLSYNSQTVDGANGRTQAAWTGMGWSLDTGYIQRNQNGTLTWEDDDTFSISANGIGGTMFRLEDSQTYHTADESFAKIVYDPATDSWTAWDKGGTQYIFGSEAADKARYPLFDPEMCYQPYNGYLGDRTWQWSLSKIRNVYGIELNYNYQKASKNVDGVCVSDPNHHAVDTAIYPLEIRYPGNYYRVWFQQSSGRTDYDTAWNTDQSLNFFQRNRLDEIRIEHNPDGDANFAGVTLVRKYELVYAAGITDDPAIFPNYVWPAGGKTLTLKEIREYGKNGAGPLPSTTFTYGDGMHLTSASNGYGGSVAFTYEAWYEVTTAYDSALHQVFGCYGGSGDGGWTGHDGGSFTCDDPNGYMRITGIVAKGIPPAYFHPGGYYLLTASLEATYSGDQARVAISNGYADTDAAILSLDTWQFKDASGILQLSATTNQYASWQVKTYTHAKMDAFEAWPLMTRWRVTAKTLTDDITDQSSTITFNYDGPATNDDEHSAYIHDTDPYWQLTDSEYAEFRGHSMVEIIGPEDEEGHQIVSTSFFYQDDARKGNTSVSITSVQDYQQPFNAASWSSYDADWDYLAAQPTFERVTGDLAMKQTDTAGNWSARFYRPVYDIADGDAMMVQFRVSGASAESIIVLDSGVWGVDFRRWGIKVKSDNSVVSTYCIGTSCYDTGTDTLIAANNFKRDTWYVLLVIPGSPSQNATLRLWERDNPSGAAQVNHNMEAVSERTWRFMTYINNGTLWLDTYSEGRIASLSESLYTESILYDSVDNGSIPDLAILRHEQGTHGAYPNLAVRWTRLEYSTSMSFDADADWVGVRSWMEYRTEDQNGAQYGNQTRATTLYWDRVSQQWKNYRWSLTKYYPTNSGSVYLVSLPGFTNSYTCANYVCDEDLSDLLGSTTFYYDSNTSFTQPPSQGELARQRNFVCFANSSSQCYAGYYSGYAKLLYTDQTFTYDDWGNPTTATSYSGYGDATTFASAGAQTGYTYFDTIYHTYVLQTRNALDQYTTMVYDYALGVPTSLTDPNGVQTTATYDDYGRMLTIRKPGDESGRATIVIRYEDFYFRDYGKPFMVDIQQKLDDLDVDNFLELRKFYNGLGQKIQVQSAGLVLDSGQKDVIIDTSYDVLGRVDKSTVPYEIDEWYSGMPGYPTPWRGQPLTQPSPHTDYDEWGRAETVTALDGIQTHYTYSEGYVLDVYYQETCVISDYAHPALVTHQETCTRSDRWGRTTEVHPETGPWNKYTYNGRDQLTSVQQMNASGGEESSTALTYDVSGRKLSMTDADMGVWTYAYNALGGLVRQTDAKSQTTCMYYDSLNRLKGKNYQTIVNCPTIDPNSYTVGYTYDSTTGGNLGKGRRTGMTDPSGSASWVYDNRGRVTSETKIVNGTGGGTFKTEWDYNSADLIKWIKYPSGNTGYTGEKVTYNYYRQLSLNSMWSDLGTTGTGDDYYYVPQITYDEAGRLVEQRLGANYATPTGYAMRSNYTYNDWTVDDGGRLGQLTTSVNAVPVVFRQDLRYTYDNLGNVLTIQDYAQSSAQTQTFTYDGLNRIVSASASGGDGFGVYSESYSYDSNSGKLSVKGGVSFTYSAAHEHAVALLSDGSSYSYDLNGNMTTRDPAGTAAYTFGYDAENRLTSVSGSASASFVYDGDGNRVKKSAYENLVAGLPATSGGTLNWQGVVTNGDTWADSGSGSSAEFAYTTSTGLQYVQIDLGVGAAFPVDKIKVWHYAADGRTYHNTKTQVSADCTTWYTVFDSAVSGEYAETAAGKTHTFTSRSVRCVRDYLNGSTANTGNHWVEIEVWGTASTVTIGNYFEWSGSTDTMKKYYYAGGQRVAMRSAAGLNYVLGDHLGSTSVTTNASGVKYGELRYKAWGETRYLWGATPTSLRYTGQRQETGLGGIYHYGARWYDPALGRFLQADTVVSSPGSPMAYDRYAYVYNNPVRYTDPTGHDCDEDGIICTPGDQPKTKSPPPTRPGNPPSRPERHIDDPLDDSIDDATVIFSTGGQELYDLYLTFKAAGWWKEYSQDPLLLFIAILMSRESFAAWRDDTVKPWFSGEEGDPAELFTEAAVTWFWSWAQDSVIEGTYGEMQNNADQVVMMFNWMNAAMQSEDNMTLESMYNDITTNWNDGFLDIASEVYSPTDPKLKTGDGMGSWANAYLYTQEGQKLIESGQYLYKWGSGSSAWYIFSPEQVQLITPYKCPGGIAPCD